MDSRRRRRRIEMPYRLTLDAMPDRIHVVDADLRIILVNQGFVDWCRELGLPTPAVARPLFEGFPFLKDRVRDEYRRVLAEAKTLHTTEETMLGDRSVMTETWKIPVRRGRRVVRIVTIVRDITERKRAEQALRRAHGELEAKVKRRTAQLRALAMRLIHAEDAERKRIADILHEDLQQMLVALRYELQTLRDEARADRRAVFQHANDILDKATHLTRSLSADLRPPGSHLLGFREMLALVADEMKSRFGLTVRLRASAAAEPERAELRAVILDSVRELLFNVVKHAGTKAAELRVERKDGQILVEVKDRGKGYDTARASPAGIGLFKIHERANGLGGEFRVVSSPRTGTRATLLLPRRA